MKNYNILSLDLFVLCELVLICEVDFGWLEDEFWELYDSWILEVIGVILVLLEFIIGIVLLVVFLFFRGW